MKTVLSVYRTVGSLLLFCLLPFLSFAQPKVITGKVQDALTNEAIPFASISFSKSGIGRLSDSAGGFFFYLNTFHADTLVITNVGYQDYKLYIPAIQGDTLRLQVKMEPGRQNIGVVVKAKGNRGLWLWRRIVQHKPQNDRYRFSNFSYELYNKLELDINKVNKERLADIKLLKPFQFILENIDTTEGAPFLPVYVTEALSDYYYQKSPLKRREVFRAVNTKGVDNASVARLLGGMDQVVNFYNNFIPVFDKQFVSPISDNGDQYYNYKIADTQYVAGKRLVHFLFQPRRKGENTFEGDCWVHDSTYAIQKMTLRLAEDANINFVTRLSLLQEYQLINDSTWFLAKDKFVAEIAPLGKQGTSFIGRKTTTYKSVLVNDPSVTTELAKNKIMEETVLPDDALTKSEAYWQSTRHEPLSKNEASVYKMIDTLLQMPQFTSYRRMITFFGTGYLPVGKFEIGPWYNWVYMNSVEGLRLRFDLATTDKFSKKVLFRTYAAYGFGDDQWKGGVSALYLFQNTPRTSLRASFRNDFDYAQKIMGEVSDDNIFALAIRKEGVPIKFMKLEKEELEYYKEWPSGFSVQLGGTREVYEPVLNLPGRQYYALKGKDAFNTFEASVRLRFAYLERFLESSFYRTSLGAQLPIVEARYTRGISGVFNSAYNYDKLFVSISDYQKIPPFGNIYYNVFAGRTFGTLPYMFLDIAPGNEIYYYNKYAYNMMNRYEFINDRYAGVNFEHNFGNGLFRYIPLTRKLKFRQLWTAKALWGDLSDANQRLNFISGYPFKALNGQTYLELGTGVDNIFKVIRLDFVWRVLPQSLPHSEKFDRFGVFGSFRLAF